MDYCPLPPEILLNIQEFIKDQNYINFSMSCKWLWDNREKPHLKAHQIRHANDILTCLRTQNHFIDCSVMGSGKTYTTVYIAKKLKLPLFVVCPAAAISVWNRLCKLNDIAIIYITTYEALKGGNTGPKHPYLVCDEGVYSVTPEYTQLVEKGILLIFDEVHKTKNVDTRNSKACTVLARHISGNSRLGLLSASPFDKEKHVESILKLLGIIRQQKLLDFNPATLEYRYLGLRDALNFFESLDPHTTHSILSDYHITGNTCRQILFNLYVTLLVPKISFSMPPPPLPSKDLKNGYYNMTDEGSRNLSLAVSKLGNAIHYVAHNVMQNLPIDWSVVTKCLVNIETAKVEIFSRLARRDLRRYPRCKVILMLYNIDSINTLESQLSQYYPLIIHGKLTKTQRVRVIDTFQNDDRYRLLLCTVGTCNMSVSFHDMKGDMPRRLYINPRYSAIDIYQATGRVYRVGTLSSPFMRCVYGKNASKETQILNAIARKKAVLEKCISREIELPGELDYEVET